MEKQTYRQPVKNLYPDYSNPVELRILAGLAKEGDEKARDELRIRKAIRFAETYSSNPQSLSEIYGTKREEIIELTGNEQARKLTLGFIKQFPAQFRYIQGLRKAKAKMMVNALIHGTAENGNHFVTCFANDFHFYYRGTLIYKWNGVTYEGQEVHAGDFEGTDSTRNQRKEIQKAIEVFKEAVMKL